MANVTTINEYMDRNHFSRQDVFTLLDLIVSIHGKNLSPQELAERECRRLERIRTEKQKVRVNEP